MKTFFISLIPIALFGFAVFGLTRMVKFQPWTRTGQEEEYKEFRQIIARPMADANAAKLPKVDCPLTEFDFGMMPPFDNGKHVFKISNIGDDQLVLKNGGKSCSCMDVAFAAALLAPGETKDIEVTWNTDKPGKLAQYIKINTNSPETPELQLWVTGTVATIMDASVGGFGYGSMLAREVRSQDFYLYSGVWDNIVVDRIETSTDDLKCEIIDTPIAVEKSLKLVIKPDRAVEFKSLVDLRMTVTSQSSAGERAEFVNIFVRPPESVADSAAAAEASPLSRAAMYKSLQPDGTLLIQLPVSTTVVRRLSLYGPAIADGDKKLIDLGKLRTTSPARDWSIIAKIRGDKIPTEMKVNLTGIKGVSATVEQIENTTGQAGVSYRIKIHAEEKLRLGVYNREQSGKLTIESPDLPGEELLEFTVELDVLKAT